MNNLHSYVWHFLWPADCLGYLSFSITEADCGALRHRWLGCYHVSVLIQMRPACIVLREHHSSCQGSLTSTLFPIRHLFVLQSFDVSKAGCALYIQLIWVVQAICIFNKKFYNKPASVSCIQSTYPYRASDTDLPDWSSGMKTKNVHRV